MAFIDKQEIQFPASSLDAFARQRVSNPTTIFDSKQLSDNLPEFWDDSQVSGSGTTSTHFPNRASSIMLVANLTAGRRIRQTFRRFNYQPGKSQLCIFTFVMGTAISGVTRRCGLYDDNNGIFLQQTGAGMSVGVRSFVTGTAVNNTVLQAAWNIDKLDGTGASGITLDPTQSQIFFFDFECSGSVRCGFFIGGVPYYCHRFDNANLNNSVYMSTPNLPLRYEIENDGTGADASFEQICSTVISEGGAQNTGLIRGLNRGATSFVTSNNSSIYPLIALRLKAGYLGSSVRPVDFSLSCTSNAAYAWYLLLNPTASTALSFTGITNSSIEAALTTTNATTLTGGTILRSGIGSQGNQGGISQSAITDDFFLGSDIAGNRDILVLAVQRLTGTSETFYAGINIIEQK